RFTDGRPTKTNLSSFDGSRPNPRPARSGMRLLPTLKTNVTRFSSSACANPLTLLQSRFGSADIGSRKGARMLFVASLPTIEVLRRHILETLCLHDHLDPQQAVVHEGVIRRSGRPCGWFLQVSGPRMVKSYAVWAGEECRRLDYDSSGLCFAAAKLS